MLLSSIFIYSSVVIFIYILVCVYWNPFITWTATAKKNLEFMCMSSELGIVQGMCGSGTIYIGTPVKWLKAVLNSFEFNIEKCCFHFKVGLHHPLLNVLYVYLYEHLYADFVGITAFVDHPFYIINIVVEHIYLYIYRIIIIITSNICVTYSPAASPNIHY